MARLGRELGCGQAVAELGLSCWAPLANGTAVRVCGLVAAPEHNGKCGVVVGWLVEKGRCEVMLDGRPKPLRVRPPNLQPVGEPGGAVACADETSGATAAAHAIEKGAAAERSDTSA
jgi:hypothetical protein